MFRLNLRRKRPAFRAFPLCENTRELGNPYRGLYTICRLHADSIVLDEQQIPVTSYVIPEGQTLVLLEINLQRFRDDDLSEKALGCIDKAFAYFKKQRVEMIVRFLYDWDGQGAMHEPRTIERILGHMEQLAPLLKQYGTSIYILQGLFIGSWGEMHNTRYASQQHLITLATKLADCSSPHTFIAVRCPNLWRTIFRTYSPLSYMDAMRPCMQARFCLFNDAIMGSETDMGTYGTASRSISSSCTDKLNRFDEIAFQQQLCRYVPNGGEVINVSPLNDFKPAVRTMELMRLSYLNRHYDQAVLNKWAAGRHASGAFRRGSDLDYIAAHLGYRYYLNRVDMAMQHLGGTLHFEATLINRGFSACYRPMQVSLVLSAEGGQKQWTYPVDTDVRTWKPGASVSIGVDLSVPECMEGRLLVSLRVSCPLTGRNIRFANTMYPETATLTNPVGELIL